MEIYNYKSDKDSELEKFLSELLDELLLDNSYAVSQGAFYACYTDPSIVTRPSIQGENSIYAMKNLEKRLVLPHDLSLDHVVYRLVEVDPYMKKLYKGKFLFPSSNSTTKEPIRLVFLQTSPFSNDYIRGDINVSLYSIPWDIFAKNKCDFQHMQNTINTAGLNTFLAPYRNYLARDISIPLFVDSVENFDIIEKAFRFLLPIDRKESVLCDNYGSDVIIVDHQNFDINEYISSCQEESICDTMVYNKWVADAYTRIEFMYLKAANTVNGHDTYYHIYINF